MGIISAGHIVVDAILTTKGRELLSRNDGSFKITQFACGDDEVDYSLYNETHPLGSAYFGEAIELMPVMEASPSDALLLKYKLVTLPKGTSKLPTINVGFQSITLKQGASLTITPQTLNYLNAVSIYETLGYTATIADSRLLSVFTGVGIQNVTVSDVDQYANAKLSKAQVGTSFSITGTTVDTLFGTNQTKLVTTITFVGRESGARVAVPLEIIKK